MYVTIYVEPDIIHGLQTQLLRDGKNNWSTRFNASWVLNPKHFVALNVPVDHLRYSSVIGTKTISASLFMNPPSEFMDSRPT